MKEGGVIDSGLIKEGMVGGAEIGSQSKSDPEYFTKN